MLQCCQHTRLCIVIIVIIISSSIANSPECTSDDISGCETKSEEQVNRREPEGSKKTSQEDAGFSINDLYDLMMDFSDYSYDPSEDIDIQRQQDL
ncbi:unnamed protein product [Mesocestoides corti]|uniref:Secreted protein n=1 Tax=Mesocestoides corti TaxID=53468 RepID=A0A0R3UNC7_MESCO|nr:unnamed protein product [Mesocestoides corti]